MSTLERLTIRGIRNFGVDAEDEQKIAFTTPLTLILGQNGSGKTTIIECIKYALTGETPPNCKGGIGFINNPDILHISESLGQTKLRIKNVRNIETTVCRSAKVIKKAQKYQFKSLDATITFNDLNDNDREISTSKRNNDATEDMCTAMGVSKAIINNVLFCHQEDANWPLGTDQEVMTRFDQIFGTTEYNNALEKMRNMRKKYDNEIKDKKVNLKELEMIKQEADKKHMEISSNEDEIQNFKEKIEKCINDLVPLRKDYERVLKISEQLSSITSSKTQLQTELNNEEKNAEKCRSKIQTIFTGSETELMEEIDSFKSRYSQKEKELSKNEEKLKNTKDELDKITERYNEYKRKYSNLLANVMREQESYAEKADYIKELCDKLKVNVNFDIKNDNTRASGLIPSIQTAMSQEEASINEIVKNNNKVNDEFEKELRGYCENAARIKSEIDSITKRLKDLEQTLNKQKAEIKQVETSSRYLAEIRKKIEKVQGVHDEKTASSNIQGTKDEIAKHREEKKELNDKLDAIDEQITILTSMASVLAEVESLKKRIEKRENDFRRIKNKHHENFERLFPGETIESNFKRRIETIGQKLQTDVNKHEAEIRLGENKIQTIKAQHQSKKQELITMENELRKLEGEIDSVCEQTPFATVLADTKESVAKWQMEHSEHQSSELLFKRYIQKIEDKPCCPLCHKDMNGNEVGDLTEELNEKIEMLPQNIARTARELKTETIKLEKLLGLQSHVDRVDKLKAVTLPKVKDEIKELELNLSTIQDKVKQSQRLVEDPREKKEIVNKMVGDMSLLDEATRDIEQAQKDLELKSKCFPSSDGPNDNNLESLQKERKQLTEQIKALEKDIDRKVKRYQDDEKQITSLKEKVMLLMQEELKLQGDTQKFETLRDREKELNEKITELEQKKNANNQELIPIEAKINITERKRSEVKQRGDETCKAAMKRFDEIKKTFDRMEGVSKELEKLALLNLETEIERCENSIKRLNDEKTKQLDEIRTIEEKIKLLTKEMSEQKDAHADFKENLELKNYQKKIEEKKKELEMLLKQEKEVDFQTILNEKAKLQQSMEKITLDRTRMDGQMKEKQSTIDKIRAEINQPKFRDAVRNYKRAYYESHVLKKTIEDLTTYCETLERALTKFHSDKMEKINSLIRDLWRNIYKGNDIDYIQINTEEVKGTAKRRAYTYRVVASKNDTFMDFRGQSSAGQRVLACLIIRIALAETFSGHCGVLALDEPTTNLDKINIESLCEALNRLVEEREGQRNFMLIVITHDEDFISSMGRVTSYTRVFRDMNGRSRTQKLRVQ